MTSGKPILILFGNFEKTLNSFDLDRIDLVFFYKCVGFCEKKELIAQASLIVLSALQLELPGRGIIHSLTLAAEIREINPQAKIWISSAYAQDVDFETWGPKIHCDRLINFPPDTDEISQYVLRSSTRLIS